MVVLTALCVCVYVCVFNEPLRLREKQRNPLDLAAGGVIILV